MGQGEELGEVGPEMARTVWAPSAIKTMLEEDLVSRELLEDKVIKTMLEQELASKRLLEAKAIKTMWVVD